MHRPETSSADTNLFGPAVLGQGNFLNIRRPTPLGGFPGMTDVMSKLWALATHIALLGHYVLFPHSHELRLHITTYRLIAQENPLRELGVIH